MLNEKRRARILQEETYRHEARTQLEKKTPKTFKEKILVFMQSALGLALISIFLTVFIPYLNTTFAAIQAEKSKINEQKRKLKLEMGVRIQALEFARKNTLLTPTEIIKPATNQTIYLVNYDAMLLNLSKVVDAYAYSGNGQNQSVVFVFDELKDRPFRSLVYEYQGYCSESERLEVTKAGAILQDALTNLTFGSVYTVSTNGKPTEPLQVSKRRLFDLGQALNHNEWLNEQLIAPMNEMGLFEPLKPK